MTTLPDHLERYLGEIQRGWVAAGERIPTRFQVAEFAHGPVLGTIAFATLGLARVPLTSRRSGRPIRHELLMAAADSNASVRFIPALLESVATEAISNGHAYLRGDVIGPRGPLFAGSALEALYVATPSYFPDGIAAFREAGHDIAVIWLVPITRAEAQFVFAHGWDLFEDRLLADQPDLLDLHRPSMRFDGH